MTRPACTSCKKLVTPTGYGGCPLCGGVVDVPAQPEKTGFNPNVAKVVVLVAAIVAAFGYVGWKYHHVFANDPKMLGIVALGGVLGLFICWSQVQKWRRRVSFVRDLM